MTQSKKHIRTAVLLLVISAAACAPATPLATPAPLLQTAQVTREITQVVTQEVTVEVTQVVEVPVTNTPTPILETATPTPTPTVTKIPSATPTWDPPRVEVVGVAGTERTACWYGPSTDYLYKVGQPNGAWMRAIGRNEDGTWLVVDAGPKITNFACWMLTSNVKFHSGGLADLPVTWLGLNPSSLYPAPKVFTTSRDGNEVTISWQPIWMTEDDYRGYMIETWVCQGGKLVFRPIGMVTTYIDNQVVIQKKGAYSVKVTDEPGCTQSSRARIYAVEKHGYTNYMMLPWPAATP